MRRVRSRGALAVLPIVAASVLCGCATSASPTASPSALPAPASRIAASTVSTAGPSGAPTASPASPDASPSTSSAAGAPPELGVDCTTAGTTPATDSVAVQLDGVHFRVRSDAEGRAFQVDGVGGDNAPFPSGTLVWAVPPGDIRIWCGPTDPTAADWVAIRVLDPNGLYADDQLACASATHGSFDFGEGARGQPGDPIVIARGQLQGLLPGDHVEGAGYPATALRKVRVTRDGAIVAVGTYQPDGEGGWLLGGVDSCSDAGLRWGS